MSLRVLKISTVSPRWSPNFLLFSCYMACLTILSVKNVSPSCGSSDCGMTDWLCEVFVQPSAILELDVDVREFQCCFMFFEVCPETFGKFVQLLKKIHVLSSLYLGQFVLSRFQTFVVMLVLSSSVQGFLQCLPVPLTLLVIPWWHFDLAFPSLPLTWFPLLLCDCSKVCLQFD